MKPNPRHIEESGLNAWPALQTNLYDGWVLRFAKGYTKRANSITPVYPSTLSTVESTVEKIERCEAIYARHQQPTIFRLPSFHPDTPKIDTILASRGYIFIDETSVQVADLEWCVHEENECAQNMLYPAHWLPIYHKLDETHSDSETHAQMLNNIVGEAGYFVLREHTSEDGPIFGDTVACGLSVCQGGYVGLYDIVVGTQHRRQGYGAELVGSLLEWGIEHHQARYAYLSVVADNGPAINLYTKFGFNELYRYHYRVAPD